MGGCSTKIVITQSLVAGLIKSGSASLSRGDNTISFATPMPNSTYEIMGQAYTSTSVIGWEIKSKTVNSFVVNVDEACEFLYMPII
jgi:hypothetical protein